MCLQNKNNNNLKTKNEKSVIFCAILMSPTHPPPLPFLPDVLQIALLDYFVLTPIILTARLLLVQKLSGLDMYCGFG